MPPICWLCHYRRDLLSFNTDDVSEIHQDYLRRLVEEVVGFKFTSTTPECICVYCSVEVYNFYVFRNKSKTSVEQIQELIYDHSSPPHSEYESLEEDQGAPLPSIEKLKLDFVPWLKSKLPAMTETPQTVSEPEPNFKSDKDTQVNPVVTKDLEIQCNYPETLHKRVQCISKSVKDKRIQCRITMLNSDKQVQCDIVGMEDKETSIFVMADHSIQCDRIISSTSSTQVDYVLKLDKQVECNIITSDQFTQCDYMTMITKQTQVETVSSGNKGGQSSQTRQRKSSRFIKSTVDSPCNTGKESQSQNIQSKEKMSDTQDKQVTLEEITSGQSVECNGGMMGTQHREETDCEPVFKRKRRTLSPTKTKRKSLGSNKSTVKSPCDPTPIEDKQTADPTMSDQEVTQALSPTKTKRKSLGFQNGSNKSTVKSPCDPTPIEDKQTADPTMSDQEVTQALSPTKTKRKSLGFQNGSNKSTVKSPCDPTPIEDKQTADPTMSDQEVTQALSPTKTKRKSLGFQKGSNKSTVKSPCDPTPIEDKQTADLTMSDQEVTQALSPTKTKRKSLGFQKGSNKSTVKSPCDPAPIEDKQTADPTMSDQEITQAVSYQNIQCDEVMSNSKPVGDDSMQDDVKFWKFPSDLLFQCVNTMDIQHHKKNEGKKKVSKRKNAMKKKSSKLNKPIIGSPCNAGIIKDEQTTSSISSDHIIQCNRIIVDSTSDTQDKQIKVDSTMDIQNHRTTECLTVLKRKRGKSSPTHKSTVDEPAEYDTMPHLNDDANKSNEIIPEDETLSKSITDFDIKEERPSSTEILHVDAEGIVTSPILEAHQLTTVKNVTNIRYKKCSVCNERIQEIDYYRHRSIHLTCSKCKRRSKSIKQYYRHINTVCDVKMNATPYVRLTRISLNGLKQHSPQSKRRKTK